MNPSNQLDLRVVMDLSAFKFKENQKIGVISDGPFQNKLHDSELNSITGSIFNSKFHTLDYMFIENTQHMVVILTYGGGKVKKLHYPGNNVLRKGDKLWKYNSTLHPQTIYNFSSRVLLTLA